MKPSGNISVHSVEAILESIDDLVFELDRDGLVLKGWSKENSKTHLPASMFVGKKVKDFFPAELSRSIEQALLETLRDQTFKEVEYKSPYDNRWFNARFNVVKDTDHIVVLMRDVTRLHQIQAQIALSEHRFRNLIKHSSDIITIIQLDGTITYQSETYSRVFGYEVSVVGRNIFDFIHPEDQAYVMAEIKRGVEKGGVSDLIEFRYRHSNGNWIWIESRGNNLINEPGIEGIVVNSRDISERKAAEDKIKKNEERYRNLLHNSMDIITVLNEKGEVILDSFSILTQFGYDKPLEGSSIFDFIHPDDVERAIHYFTESIKKPGVTEPMEFRFKSADGSWRHVEAIGNNMFHDPSINGFVINSRDVTERKKIESALTISQARTQAILESTRDHIFAIDREYRYVSFNRSHKEIIKNLYGVDIQVGDLALVNNDRAERDRDPMKSFFDRSLKGEQFIHVYEVDNPGTVMQYAEISFNPIRDSNGDVIGVAVFSKDITEIKRTEEALIYAKNEAIAAATAKSEFLSNMSHEIRTPMNAIIGMTDILLEKITDEETREYLKSIKFSSDNLLVVINDILDFSKIEAGKVALEFIDFNLSYKLEELRKIFDHKAADKEIYFRINIDKNVPEIVNGDPYRLNQILVNLIGNAIKFTHHGGVDLNVRLRGIEHQIATLQFDVTDTGIGIPKDKMESIFESFSQAYTDTTRKYGGTGLGLAITKKLAYLLGGKIDLKSEINKGSSFSVDIPYSINTNLKSENIQTFSDTESAQMLEGLKILVAEDNALNQFLIRQTLSKWNCDITISGNGEEAITLLKDEDFDLVLMDLQMPVMNGYEATRIIRSKNTVVRNPMIPVIALTADAFPETKRKVLETGMNDFVAKPFKREELSEKIIKVCHRKIQA